MRGNIRRAVAEMTAKFPRSPGRAVIAIEKIAARDAGIRKEFVRLGIQQCVRNFFSQQRTSAMTMAAARARLPDDQHAARLSSRLARIAFWDTYTTFGMQPIGDATRETLIESAENREKQANGELRLAKFERTVAGRLKPGEIVRNAIDLRTLEKLAARYNAGGLE